MLLAVHTLVSERFDRNSSSYLLLAAFVALGALAGLLHWVAAVGLVAATIGVVGGFTLPNQALYETVGRDWYKVGDSAAEPGFIDFLAYTLINLFRVVDLLHIASSYQVLEVTFVEQSRWPAATLLM